MELYYRPVSVFDKKIMDDFALEHKNNSEVFMAGDCSIILGTGYQQINDFYKWYKMVSNLDAEEHFKKGQVGCSCYLVFRKSDDKLIGIFDIRHSLKFKFGNVYGHIGISIRPTERRKGYYKEVLIHSLNEANNYNINPVVISCEYDNIASKKGIEHVYGNYKDIVPCNGTHLLVYEKYLDNKKEI